MKKLIIVSSLVVVASVASAQQTSTPTPSQPTVNTPVVKQSEVRVEPGAILMAWKGKNMMEADIAAKVDTEKSFNIRNIESDPVARSSFDKICKWSGILNVAEPGVYSFSAIGSITRDSGSCALIVNGKPIFSMEHSGTSARNVSLPGPVNVDVVIYNPMCNIQNASMFIRFKKTGSLNWTVLTPAMLMHPVQ